MRQDLTRQRHVNSSTSARNLLIVENDAILRRAMDSWLQLEFPALQIDQADSAEAALEIAEASAPDIVLMDIGLPKLNGLEATEKMHKVCPDASIIIVTIHEDDHYISQAARAGAVDFIPKRRLYIELVPILKEMLADGSPG
jgi:DNA-binding NarL/FixJ family response regulator